MLTLRFLPYSKGLKYKILTVNTVNLNKLCRPQSLLPRGERPNPLREKNAAVNSLLRSWLPRLGQAQFLDVSGEIVHSDGSISAQDMFDFLHLTSTGYRNVAKPLSDLLLQILDETPEERRASLVWKLWPSNTFIQKRVSLAPVEDGGDKPLVSGRG